MENVSEGLKTKREVLMASCVEKDPVFWLESRMNFFSNICRKKQGRNDVVLFIISRYDQGRDNSQHYYKDYEATPSRDNEEDFPYNPGTLESSKNSGLSSSSYELSQYINGAENNDPVLTSDAGNSAKWIIFPLISASLSVSHDSWILFPQCLRYQLLWSSPSLMWWSVLGLGGSWYGSVQVCPHRRTSVSWKSTVWRLVHLNQCRQHQRFLVWNHQ